ncbi:MAG: iron-sulfur cluster carrier protein ApbC [Nitrospinae bacterium]|nr:iron-sulfur cluster carrier protein ApbC [Nitrospinota bacterium]
MSSFNVDKVMEALSQVNDPELHRDLVSLNMVKDVRVDGSNVALTVELTTPACPMKGEIKNRVETALTAAGASAVDLSFDARVPQARGSSERTTIEGVRNIIAVASGKGGVGKSTVAVNLTMALAQTGAKMGLLDADVYGPSIPTLMKLEHAPQVKSQDDKIIPLESYGVKTISMGFLTTKDTPVIWRGPMIHKIMQEFIRNVAWGELDYLVMDLPPGTGDTQLTLVQTVPIAGAVIVTTPQELSLMDARKGLIMFERVEVPVLGIVENMSYFSCPHCSERTDIFASGGGKSCAEELGVDLLAEIPLIPAIRECSDEGVPIVLAQPDSEARRLYDELAGKVAAKLSVLALTKIDLPVIQ